MRSLPTLVAALIFLPYLGLSLETTAKQAFLMEESTSTEIFNKNGDEKMAPSSMSKLMTLYLTFKNLKDGRIKLTDEYIVSKKAWAMGGSRMFLEEGKRVNVNDLIRGIIVDSGNDASVSIAELISGSEDEFVSEMNILATKIGLTGSYFKNASGWPDKEHLMTARDLAILARAIIKDYPEYYHYFSEKEFKYNNITQQNRNNLLGKFGVDGLKTGTTDTGGFGVTLSAKKNDVRVIAVINGLKTTREREQEGAKLISFALNNFKNLKLISKDYIMTKLAIWYGKEGNVPVTVQEDVGVFVKNHINSQDIKILFAHESVISAPIAKGQVLGSFIINLDGKNLRTVPAIAQKDIDETSIVGKFAQNVNKLLVDGKNQ
ncbi:DacC superfamily D-alanyl-D-alanine carboxypeptidase [Candidatus Cyrtobacter comes]|uniref:serine-type D-Ala-D-Ala carboxypeptidase n=1 Tax=Candidatus Cyrtobacter comes TaxID=675776 RepID=A0ABU5L6S2_9RICK|nr:D-alanyl-D-alanine carboxypeptidase family protein [Candidatus Cyrtobacter comes]MDZ5761821.1 DacC superfamily D-alanyl-D-alanine carboxypeptidase [Candidatus Cyrtobacter comes]